MATNEIQIKINKELFKLVTAKLRILFYIGMAERCALSQLQEITKASWTTINAIVPWLQEHGLIEIIEEKTSSGGKRKVLRLTEKGKKLYNKILELNDLLNNLDLDDLDKE